VCRKERKCALLGVGGVEILRMRSLIYDGGKRGAVALAGVISTLKPK
jgi:hypothetical protein